MLNKNDKVVLLGCSDPLKKYDDVTKVLYILREFGLNPVISPILFHRDSEPKEKAAYLNSCFEDEEVKAIFDVSGGDLSNEILEYLNYNIIKKNAKPFFGYSDLTCVLSAINKNCKMNTYLYQVKNIIYKNRENFFGFLMKDNNSMLNFKYEFLQGTYMDGRIAGGNIRCLLKLAGTKYFPDLYGKILFLESRSGNDNRIRAYFAQLKQIGVFNMVSGVILGTFTELEKDCSSRRIIKIAQNNIPANIPIIKTEEIGHSVDSKILEIGKYYRIGEKLNTLESDK